MSNVYMLSSICQQGEIQYKCEMSALVPLAATRVRSDIKCEVSALFPLEKRFTHARVRVKSNPI